MSASNYPPGMTRSDWDHVEGIVRCADCGAELPEDADSETCPEGCAPDYDAADPRI